MGKAKSHFITLNTILNLQLRQANNITLALIFAYVEKPGAMRFGFLSWPYRYHLEAQNLPVMPIRHARGPMNSTLHKGPHQAVDQTLGTQAQITERVAAPLLNAKQAATWDAMHFDHNRPTNLFALESAQVP